MPKIKKDNLYMLPEIIIQFYVSVFLSDDLNRMIVIVNNVVKYDHCKDGDPGNDACSIYKCINYCNKNY